MTSTHSDDPVRSRVAGNVRMYRQARHLTLEELSTRLDVAAGVPISAAALLRLEQGKRGVEAGDLVALALALDVDVTTLLGPATHEDADELAVGAGRTLPRPEYLSVIGVGGPIRETDPGTEAVVVPAEQMQAIASAFAAVGAAAGDAARQFGMITSNAKALHTIAANGHPRSAGGANAHLLRQAGYTTEQLRDRFGPGAAMNHHAG